MISRSRDTFHGLCIHIRAESNGSTERILRDFPALQFFTAFEAVRHISGQWGQT
jgi:hypothetical protein